MKDIMQGPADPIAKRKDSPGKYDGKNDGIWSNYPRSKGKDSQPEKFYDTTGPFGQF